MANLWLIIQREFVSNVLTSRFMIGFIVCLLSTAVAVFVQVDDYEKRLAELALKGPGEIPKRPSRLT